MSTARVVRVFAGLMVLLIAGATPSRSARAADPAPAVTPASLAATVKRIATGVGGKVGVSLLHLESGASTGVGDRTPLPLYSVFKVPVAIAVLKHVEEGKLTLEQEVNVTPEDVVAGGAKPERWKDVPARYTVQQLIDLSIVDSDNTSTDKLLALVGGPAVVDKRVRALGFEGITIRNTTRQNIADRGHPNRASAQAITRLLEALHKGQGLRAQERAVLWDSMTRARTGLKRLRGLLPEGTPVLDKTGTGAAGSATNDTGIITLPNGRGHLAITVLVVGSKKSVEDQERAIAEIARAAFDAHASGS